MCIFFFQPIAHVQKYLKRTSLYQKIAASILTVNIATSVLKALWEKEERQISPGVKIKVVFYSGPILHWSVYVRTFFYFNSLRWTLITLGFFCFVFYDISLNGSKVLSGSWLSKSLFVNRKQNQVCRKMKE